MPSRIRSGLPSASRISSRPLADRLRAGQLLEAGAVDGDRERRGADGAAVGQVDGVAVRLVTDPLPDQPDEVGGAAGQLEADDVRTEQALEDLPAPRELLEQLGRGERDVQEEADPQVRAQLAEHLRHQLHLVVLHPDGGVLRGHLGGLGGEPLVDGDVGVPPLTVEGRLGHHVVVERPQGAVGEALVELLHLLRAHRHRHQREALVDERLDLLVGVAGPADPGAVVLAHHRLEGGDQAAGGLAPAGGAVGLGHPVDGQPVGHDHEVRGAGGSHVGNPMPCRRASCSPLRASATVLAAAPFSGWWSPGGAGSAAGPRAPRAPRRPPPRGPRNRAAA